MIEFCGCGSRNRVSRVELSGRGGHEYFRHTVFENYRALSGRLLGERLLERFTVSGNASGLLVYGEITRAGIMNRQRQAKERDRQLTHGQDPSRFAVA